MCQTFFEGVDLKNEGSQLYFMFILRKMEQQHQIFLNE
jgi:hypothetical protein